MGAATWLILGLHPTRFSPSKNQVISRHPSPLGIIASPFNKMSNGNGNTAYCLIEERLPEFCEKLLQFLASIYWVHESVVFNFIGLLKGSGLMGQCDALTSLLSCIKRGMGGEEEQLQINRHSYCWFKRSKQSYWHLLSGLWGQGRISWGRTQSLSN